MEINQIIGQNLKRIRKEQGLTLVQLEKLSNVSKGVISLIESGETNTTINTIWKLADALRIHYSILLDAFVNPPKIIKKKEAVKKISSDGSYQILGYFNEKKQKNFKLYQMVLARKKKYVSTEHIKKCEKYVLVTQGCLNLKIENKNFILNVHDIIKFDATVEHTYMNLGNEQVIATIIDYHP